MCAFLREGSVKHLYASKDVVKISERMVYRLYGGSVINVSVALKGPITIRAFQGPMVSVTCDCQFEPLLMPGPMLMVEPTAMVRMMLMNMLTAVLVQQLMQMLSRSLLPRLVDTMFTDHAALQEVR